jgi:hypothetical protein
MKAVNISNVALELILTVCRYNVPIIYAIHLNAYYSVPLYYYY